MFDSKKARGAMSLLFAFLTVVSLSTTGCRVTQTEEGRAPDVDVKVDDGKLPKYDVDTADVEVKTKETTVNVPDVDVKTEKKKIEVPEVDVKMPPEDNKPPQQ